MNLTLTRSSNYEKAVLVAKSTMLRYFRELDIEWDEAEYLNIYRSCELYEIFDEEQVGHFLLREHGGKLFIADLQIFDRHRNKGYGHLVLSIIKTMAENRAHTHIRLKVFKTNPALELYRTNGFELEAEEQHVYLLRSAV